MNDSSTRYAAFDISSSRSILFKRHIQEALIACFIKGGRMMMDNCAHISLMTRSPLAILLVDVEKSKCWPRDYVMEPEPHGQKFINPVENRLQLSLIQQSVKKCWNGIDRTKWISGDFYKLLSLIAISQSHVSTFLDRWSDGISKSRLTRHSKTIAILTIAQVFKLSKAVKRFWRA